MTVSRGATAGTYTRKGCEGQGLRGAWPRQGVLVDDSCRPIMNQTRCRIIKAVGASQLIWTCLS